MQSAIILGGEKKSHDHIIQNYHPKNYIIQTIQPETSSIKLKQVQELHTLTSTIPNKKRLVWIREAEKLTLAAQNALLKLLEEPPAKTLFILETNNLKNLLPTIKSRCIIKRVGESELVLNQKTLKQLKLAMKKTPGERIELSHEINKNRQQAIIWIEEVIDSLHKTLRTTKKAASLQLLNRILHLALKTKDNLQSNTNVALTLEDFFLSLPEIK